MRVLCAGSRRDGGPCTASVEPPQRFCWWHDPKHADERQRNASRAGRSRPSREVAALKRQLQEIADGTLAGDTDPRAGAVAVQALNALARVLELERHWKSSDELELRIRDLENARTRRYG